METNRHESGSQMSPEKSIESTARERALYTRDFLQRKGLSLSGFVDELQKDPWNISIKAEDDKSLALGVAKLQKALGFRQTDSSRGCDGKLGSYTWKKFQTYNTSP